MNLAARLSRLRDAGPGSRRAGGPRTVPPQELDPSAFGEAPAPTANEGPPPSRDALQIQAQIARLRARLEGLTTAHRCAVFETPWREPLARSRLAAHRRETEFGEVYAVEHLLDSGHRHGFVEVGLALEADFAAVAEVALDKGLATVDPSRILVLDTETTGLSAGTGVVPFLIGLAWFDEGALRVEQLFLRRPGQEAPLLHRLADRVASSSCLVTYNGKSYDWPLLSTRFVLNRLEAPVPAAHLDLLHCLRRVVKRRMPTLRLVHVEEEVLGFSRQDDIESSQIGERYFDYLRSGDAMGLTPIFEHNANDLIALPAALGWLATAAAGTAAKEDARDRLCLAEVALKAGDLGRAQRFAERAAALPGCQDPVAVEARCLQARLLKRQRQFEAAAEALEDARVLADRDDVATARIHLALSKLYEHNLKDLEAALAHARHSARAEGPADHDKRLARIERRLGR